MKKMILISIMVLTIFVSINLSGITGSSSTDKLITITAAYLEQDGTSQDLAYKKFKEYVEEKSNNRVRVQLYPNGQMGGERKTVEAVSLGTLTISETITSVLTTYSSDFEVLDLPFIFSDKNSGFKALDGKLGARFDNLLLERGFRNLGYGYSGARSMSNNVRPIYEPNDVKGLKMRVMETPVYIDFFKTLGANPVPISFDELFIALQQGTVDGEENPPTLFYSSKFYEVQKYYSLTEHTYGYLANLINESFYQSLPEDIRTIIDDGAKKYLVDWQRQEEVNQNIDILKKLEAEGLIINEISPDNRQKFFNKMAPLYDKYKKKLGEEIFDLVVQ